MVPLQNPDPIRLNYHQQLLLYALLSIVTALSLNIMLPAYPLLRISFGDLQSSQLQQTVLMFVVGMLGGELLLGVLSDRFGRRPIFVVSVVIYLLGSLICLFSTSFFTLLAGRFIQGIGAAGQKVSLRAIIRDQYTGAAMARLSSLITLTTVFVPFVAPFLGQSLAYSFGWRSIFAFLFLFGGLCLLLFWRKQAETLAAGKNSNLGRQAIVGAGRAFLLNPHALGYTLVAGLLFGVQLSYLSLTPLFFSDIFRSPDLFVYCFGFIASAYGCALLVNSLLVMHWGMYRLVFWALAGCCLVGGIIIWIELQTKGLNLRQFILLMYLLLFGIGSVFGNIIAMAMEPLGKMAGLGGALSASISSLVALVVSYTLGAFYHQTLLSFGIGICACALVALLIIRAVQKIPLLPLAYPAVLTTKE